MVDDASLQLPVGLDDTYRFSEKSPTGLPAALKGKWVTSDTFLLRYSEPSGVNHFRLRMTFDGDDVAVQFTDLTGHFPEQVIEGQVQP